VLADIYVVISPGLKYGGQRDAVALTVAERWSPTTAASR
jgi:hypothetical protein